MTARSQEHSAHGAIHRAVAGSVQGFLAWVTPRRVRVRAPAIGSAYFLTGSSAYRRGPLIGRPPVYLSGPPLTFLFPFSGVPFPVVYIS
jgi:hypothetical protein